MTSQQVRSGAARRVALGAALALVLATGAAACTSAPPPDPAAAALAAGLTSGDLAPVPWQGTTGATATAAYAAAVKGLGARSHTTTVASVAPDAQHDDRATATLTTTWVVGPAQSASGTATGTASGATSGTAPGTGSATTSASGPPAATTWRYTSTAGLTLVDGAWRVVWSPALIAPELTAGEALRIVTEAPKRADILGAGGTPLVTERDVYQVGIDKSRVAPAAAQASARRLAVVVGIDPAGYAKAVAAGGAKQFVIAVTLRRTDPMLKKVEAASPTIDGAARVPLTLPLAPTRDFARAILGSVGPATAEIIAKSNGALTASDLVGIGGLEARYDAQLRGTPATRVEAVSTSAGGATVARTLFTAPAVVGIPLRTTLDQSTQFAAEAALRTTTTPAALVAIRPSTGEILAAANGPASGGLNLATDGRFAPGSTFKIISSLALLRSGLTPASPLPCTASISVDGKQFVNYDAYPASGLGQIPLTTAVANSCNTAFISQHTRVDQAALASAAAALGFGVDLDLGFPAYLGSIPADATGTEHAASFIGQAKVAASPMVMATVVASVLAGHTVRPVLLPEWTPKAAAPTPAAPLTTAEAASLRQLLHAVVTSGSGRVLAPAGVEVAKTGTAEYADGAATKKYTWMVGGRGDLAVAVFVKDGISGSASAGPVVLSFLRGLAQDAATP